MTGILTKINRRVRRVFYVDLDHDYRNSIFLAGTGRSGTTWISEIINYKNEYRYIFEPFHPDKVRESKIFGVRRYIRPGCSDMNLLGAAEYILSGKIRNFWADNFNAKFICTKRLIKCIRANLFLRWLYENFPGLSIILLIRHPCATALSHIMFNLKINLADYLIQDELIDDYLKPFEKEINEAENLSDFQKHIFMWCIENYVPLNQFRRGEICISFYENFCEKPEEEIKRVFSFLGKTPEAKIFNILRKPAPLAREWSAILKGENLVRSWKNQLTGDEIKRSNDILSLFGLSNIYDSDGMPNIENLYSIMKKKEKHVLV